ncbi:MAG TPA: hypothetical protein VER03_09855 [Bryobacteraceae bacterium]|nr:hypothetical protein [Bryobacteraceae bacterium]
MKLLVLALLGMSVWAQAPPTEPSPEHLAAMKKLSWMIGEWRGEAWMQVGPQKHTSTGTEVVQSRLNGSILTVEGSFKDATGKPTHTAFGVLSFNPRSDWYRFHAFTGAGQMADAKVAMRDNGFDWSFEAAPGVQVRYRVNLDENGEWVEKGEMTREGKTVQFFEMRLRKVE